MRFDKELGRFTDDEGRVILPFEMACVRTEWGLQCSRPWKIGPVDLRPIQREIWQAKMISALRAAVGEHVVAGWLSTYELEERGVDSGWCAGNLYWSTQGSTYVPSGVAVEREVVEFLEAGHEPAYWIIREPLWNWLRAGWSVSKCVASLAMLINGIRRADPAPGSRPIVWSEAHVGWAEEERPSGLRNWTEANFRECMAELAPEVEVVGVDLYQSDPRRPKDWRPMWWNIPELAGKPRAVAEMAWNPYPWLDEQLAKSARYRRRLERTGHEIEPVGKRGYPIVTDHETRIRRFGEQMRGLTHWEDLCLVGYHGGVSFAGSALSSYTPWGILYEPVTGTWWDPRPIRGIVDDTRERWRQNQEA